MEKENICTSFSYHASQAGTVVTAEDSGGMLGLYVVIDYENGDRTRYLHCSVLLVTPGEYVLQGQPIAEVGDTGAATAPHLHFELIIAGTTIDPTVFLHEWTEEQRAMWR